jgi:glutamate mutase epsilon subunit
MTQDPVRDPVRDPVPFARSNQDLGAYVRGAAGLLVQPRMGMSDPRAMAEGLRAVSTVGPQAIGTITLDSYTRVGDHEGARAALDGGGQLNGFPIVLLGPEVTREVAAAAGDRPVQVRHGSAMPQQIFRTMVRAGLSISEGGPVSYCLPYGRTPLAESVAHWRDATQELAESCRERGRRAHLETFGGCLLGQLCPPSLLVAISLLEAMFFVQNGVRSVSLSYAQQTDQQQDLEALAALRHLAALLLGPEVDWHVVLYTYMGQFPGTVAGANLLVHRSAELAVLGGADRIIVKTSAEAYRLPTVAENVESLRAVSATARRCAELPGAEQVDYAQMLQEVSALIGAVLQLSDDIGTGLLKAFAAGLIDVPFCLHQDNRGETSSAIDDRGRLVWAATGNMPLTRRFRRDDGPRITSGELLRMLRHTADEHDRSALAAAPRGPVAEAVTGSAAEASAPSAPPAADRLPGDVLEVEAGPQHTYWATACTH